MDPIARINRIQSALRDLTGDLEALKQDFIGDSPTSFDADTMGVLQQMRDISKIEKEPHKKE